jgi:hypothetical protein
MIGSMRENRRRTRDGLAAHGAGAVVARDVLLLTRESLRAAPRCGAFAMGQHCPQAAVPIGAFLFFDEKAPVYPPTDLWVSSSLKSSSFLKQINRVVNPE